MTIEEPFVRLTSSALLADTNGEIAKNIEGYRSGQLLVMAAYIFASAGMDEIAYTIIQHGKKLDLPAMRSEYSVAIRETPEGWELEVNGKLLGAYDTEQHAQDAYGLWQSFIED